MQRRGKERNLDGLDEAHNIWNSFFQLLAKKLAGKDVSELSYFVSSGTKNIDQSLNQSINQSSMAYNWPRGSATGSGSKISTTGGAGNAQPYMTLCIGS